MAALLFLRFEKFMTRFRHHSDLLIGGLEAFLHFLDELIDAETRRPLARRVLLEGRQKFAHDGWRRDEWTGSVRHKPIVVGVGGNVGPLVGI